ncbi:Ankyrin-2 [Babesia sp. Xinjiang]|uniref:Ankyrin-2 n=1 Tax=Babesia sp. Xinjiang TaxID=462227 RepID=UPI000A24B6FD|nr:Ankyrin-2 [Babesia sp. Xinjiang]ORM41110.1 Ankyrin-2 [Babesia sp. Xinjiang]
MEDLGVVSKAVETVMSACFKGSVADLRAAVRQLLSVDSPKDHIPPEASESHDDGTFNCLELSTLESLRDAKQHSVAHIASAGGNLDVLQCLLTALPALAYFEDENGENALFYAIRAATGRGESGVNNSNFLSCVLLLLGHCGPDCVSKSGASALHIAAELGALEVCRLLVENHATVNVYSEYGTPLTVAVIRGYIDIIEFLLSHGANPDGLPDAEDNDEDVVKCRFPPPLVFACSTGQEHVFDLLLSAGASVSVCDADGWTPLHCAAESGSVSIVKKLLDRNADCNVKVQGKTPYHLAVWNGHSTVAALLRDLTTDLGPVDVCDSPAPTAEEPEILYNNCETEFRGTREELDLLVNNLREEGRLLVCNKDYTKACEVYSRAIALMSGATDSSSETLSILYSNRSHTHLMTKKLDLARTDAEKCIALNPSWPKGYFRLAGVHKASDNQVDYLHCLFQAYSHDPSNTGLRDLFQREFERSRSASASR